MRPKNILTIFILSFIFPLEGSYLTKAFPLDNPAVTFFRPNREYSAGQKAMPERKREEAVGKFNHAAR